VTAKLLVPLGAPLQLKAGEMLPPVQPKPLNTCSLTMVPPLLDVGASQGHALRIYLTRTQRADTEHLTGIGWLFPGVGMSNSNFRDCLEAKGAMRRFAGSSQTSHQSRGVPGAALAFDDIRFDGDPKLPPKT
jgi:hypothetical protein